ncbi:MAG: glycosyltransferase family 2 protein [Thermoplasmata archaeon]
MIVSIIIPCLNEKKYIRTVVEKCMSLNNDSCDIELVIVDNGSTDGTYEILLDIKKQNLAKNIIVVRETQKGKANAIKKGLSLSHGDIVVFQDADLEYDIANISKLIESIKKGADGAVSVRYININEVNIFSFIANKFFLTLFKNNIPDILSGQRAYKKSLLNTFDLKSKGFDLEIELTLKTLDYCIDYIPIIYKPRSYADGKKIGLLDFFIILKRFSHFALLP